MRSLATSKPTVNDEDMVKLDKFTKDFGQEGWLRYKYYFFLYDTTIFNNTQFSFADFHIASKTMWLIQVAYTYLISG
jgi:hypothetical protein